MSFSYNQAIVDVGEQLRETIARPSVDDDAIDVGNIAAQCRRVSSKF
jgi:hypothetical protein